MQVLTSIRIIVAIFVLNLTLDSNVLLGQGDDVKIKQLRELIAREVDLAAMASYHDYELMRIESLALEFKLNSKQLTKPKSLARKKAADQLKQCQAKVTHFLSNNRTFPENDIALLKTKIIVNGKTIANEDSTEDLEIEVDLRKRWISANRTNHSCGSWLGQPPAVDFGQTDWRGAFSEVLTSDQLSDFAERQSQALAFGAIRLATNFRFTPQQEKQVQSKIYKTFLITNQSTIGDLKSTFRRQAPKLSRLDAPFLTDSQKLLLGYANGALQFDQINQVETIKESTVKESIEAKVRQEVYSSVLAELRVELDDYMRILQPAKKKRKRWLILIKGAARRKCDGIFENSKSALEDLLDSVEADVSKFVWKGVTYQIEGQDDSRGKQVHLSFGGIQEAFQLSVKTNNSVEIFGFRRKRGAQLGLKNDERWKLELSKLEDGQLNRFKAHLLKQKRNAVIDGIVAVLTVDLLLSEKQQNLLREMLKTKVDLRLEKNSNLSNAINSLKQIQSLNFLSESQQSYFRIVKSRLGT